MVHNSSQALIHGQVYCICPLSWVRFSLFWNQISVASLTTRHLCESLESMEVCTGFSLELGIYCTCKKSLSVVRAGISRWDLPCSSLPSSLSVCGIQGLTGVHLCVHPTCSSSPMIWIKWKVLSLFFTWFWGGWRSTLQKHLGAKYLLKDTYLIPNIIHRF